MAGRGQTLDNTEAVAAALASHGLIPRGGFRIGDGEAFPTGNHGAPARSVLLVGNAGDAIWRRFREWLSRQSPVPKNPLDTWTCAVVEPIAAKFGARAVFPFDRPWPPFQQWAMRAEGLRPSPLGILMHPRFGLWHAYRAALLFETEISIQAAEKPIHLCDGCVEKPCLSTCPAVAFSESGFAVTACRGYLSAGTSSRVDSTGRNTPDCMGDGCAARNACPYGVGYRYQPEQMRFHMAAFAKA